MTSKHSWQQLIVGLTNLVYTGCLDVNMYLCIVNFVLQSILINNILLIHAKPHDATTKARNFKLEIEDVRQEIQELKDQLKELSNSNLGNGRRGKIEYCYSKECISASNNLFQWMNLDADPCDDFNEFACGNFIRTSRIPDDKKSWTASDPLEDLGRYKQSVFQN